MTYPWDEFSKCLADGPLPRRQSLRWLGAALAGAVLNPFKLNTAWAGKQDPCQAFCNRCSTKKLRNQCIDACRACNGNTSRLGGSCGNYTCCSTAVCNGACSDLQSDPNCGACGNDCRDYGETCCGNYCADLENDFDNCGSCGFQCPEPDSYEFGECIGGACLHACVEGATLCTGACTLVEADPNNCGGCGNVCPESAPYCEGGVCRETSACEGYGAAWCPGVGCTNILSDSANCGACGVRCAADEICTFGVCYGTCSGC